MVTLQEKRAETVLLYRYFKNKFVIINFKRTFSIIFVNKMNKIFSPKKVIYLTIILLKKSRNHSNCSHLLRCVLFSLIENYLHTLPRLVSSVVPN